MKKLLLILILMFSSVSNTSAEVNRIISGKENAKITIIAYESLTCSHCASFHEDVYPQLKKDYLDTGLAKIEFRHFPLDIAALNASKIVQCNQGQSLEILNSLYSNQQAWVKGNTIEDINKNLKKFIEQEGFNVNFEKCINDKEIEDFVLNDRIEGVKNFKINATPTIIINNKKFEKSLNYKNLKKSLEKLI
jgi:protein-disulfide isomerase